MEETASTVVSETFLLPRSDAVYSQLLACEGSGRGGGEERERGMGGGEGRGRTVGGEGGEGENWRQDMK